MTTAGAGLKAIRALQTAKFEDPAIAISLEALMDAAGALDEGCKQLKTENTGQLGLRAADILRGLQEKAGEAVKEIIMMQPGPTKCEIASSSAGVRVSLSVPNLHAT